MMNQAPNLVSRPGGASQLVTDPYLGRILQPVYRLPTDSQIPV